MPERGNNRKCDMPPRSDAFNIEIRGQGGTSRLAQQDSGTLCRLGLWIYLRYFFHQLSQHSGFFTKFQGQGGRVGRGCDEVCPAFSAS